MNILLHDYGGYAFTQQLAKHLAGQGHRIHYLHGGNMQAVQRSPLKSLHPNLYIDSAQIEAPFIKYNFVKRWQQEREYGVRLMARVAKIKPDVIISANAPLDAQKTLQNYALLKDIPFIYWWQDAIGLATYHILNQKNRLLGSILGNYYLFLERKLLQKSQKVIAIAESFRPIYQAWKLDERKFHILPNWAPVDDIPLFPRQNDWACKYGLDDKFVFLYSGILALKHSPELFVQLANYFCEDSAVRIVIVSEGPGADWLKTQKCPNLVVLPFQPYEDYPSLLASADVHLAVLEATAGVYSVPSKVLSYLCAGRSILMSAPLENPSVKLIQEHKTGLASSPQEIELFCENAALLRSNESLRAEMGHNARQYAEKVFDIDEIALQFINILQG